MSEDTICLLHVPDGHGDWVRYRLEFNADRSDFWGIDGQGNKHSSHEIKAAFAAYNVMERRKAMGAR